MGLLISQRLALIPELCEIPLGSRRHSIRATAPRVRLNHEVPRHRRTRGAEILWNACGDLQAETGSICGLVGPNGAGKSTMLRADAGTVRVLGEDPQGNAPLRARIGCLPGELRVATRASGATYLRQLARINSTDLGLGLDLRRPVCILSKGNKQKLA